MRFTLYKLVGDKRVSETFTISPENSIEAKEFLQSKGVWFIIEREYVEKNDAQLEFDFKFKDNSMVIYEQETE